ncbi:MAG: hypothetical protein JO236_20080 [Mycobacterium sp.]|uniref:hypothetical protein n=1 Tax=Mycobacterium sp. TaxID=1785 RepID=UPI001EB94B03|nr:hypothetical protein [Mycobacterium sp.]MBW0019829.1 hypothetical protein [Mycobacterium sp.]
MVAPTFDLTEYSLDRRRTRATPADDESPAYRLDVVAADAVDVVQAAGGWLYDRVMAGWQVSALIPHGTDARVARPLGILGVRVVEQTGFTGRGLAVSRAAFAADARLREIVFNALDDRSTDLALWGDGWPLGIDRGMTRVQYVLSAAARVFKGHALAAAGIGCGSVDPTETLLSGTAGLG